MTRPTLPSAVLLAALLAPALAAAQEHERDTWYIGGGFGTGGGIASVQGSNWTFQDLNGGRAPTNIAYDFKVGATLRPTLLLGFDTTGMRSSASGSNGQNAGSGNYVNTSVFLSNYDCMVTWFPWETGLLLRGGGGLSVLSWQGVTTSGGGGNRTYLGANLLGGLGYAYWMGERTNLTITLDASIQGYGQSSTDPENSAMWTIWLGLDWY